MHRHARSSCRFLLPCLLAALPVRANQWIGSSGDTFHSASSWSGGVPNGSNSTAEFSGDLGGISIQIAHTVGTFHFQAGFMSGGFNVRQGGSLTLINGIVNDSANGPLFNIENGLVFFSGPSPTLGNGRFTIASAGTLKLLTYADPDGSAASINLTGGRVISNNPTDGGSASFGEIKGTAGLVSLTDVAVTVGALGTDATYAGSIEAAGSLTKVGGGTWTLSGANTYTGPTLISAGTIKINNATGSAFGSGTVTIGTAGTLTGAGAFTGALQNNGVYAPGNSPALATLASFTQGSTGTLVLEIGGLTRGTGYDALDIAGAASFDGTLQVTFSGAFTAATLNAGDSFKFFNWDTINGTFRTLALVDLSAYGLAWDTSALYSTGELAVIAAIPEPFTSAALLGALTLALATWRRRR